MPSALWSGELSRRIIQRIVIEADLSLQTPAHFGNGDGDELTDMPLLKDPLDGKTPLLTGASIAGALRSYLWTRQRGHRSPLPNPDNDQEMEGARRSAAVLLFGGMRGDDRGEQSPLIIDDALGQNAGVELRHGVRIEPHSRTAGEGKLFDVELWQAGTSFKLRFELLIRDRDDAPLLKCALATALSGFTDGSITLGARKRRGYGRVHVTQWRVRPYALTEPNDLCDWIAHGNEPLEGTESVPNIKTALQVEKLLEDHRHTFQISATFSLVGSLLIRTDGTKGERGPDMVHLHARQAGGTERPILSGTSLAGALRARALRIANTLDAEKAHTMGREMFGVDIQGNIPPKGSRVLAEEHVVHIPAMQDGADRAGLVQHRVSIDRFTGGTRETALFSEQPLFGGDDTEVTVNIALLNPQKHEIGMLLLLLKDLWTGDLPLGGESSVGRGRLQGKEATVLLQSAGKITRWKIQNEGGNGGLTVDGDRNALDDYVKKHLRDYFTAQSEHEAS